MIKLFEKESSNEILEAILDLSVDVMENEKLTYLRIESDGSSGFFIKYDDDNMETDFYAR